MPPREELMGSRGELFSVRASTPKRTYFFNVKENRHGDVFLNLVESKKASERDFQRQSIVVFQEDLNGFLDSLEEAVRFMKQQRR
jgi:hypothetical protein